MPSIHDTLLGSGFFVAITIGTSTIAQSTMDANAVPDSDTTKIQEIVVTASRRAESAQKVPISISQVSGAQLDQQAITGVQGLPQVIPGLQFSAIGPQSTPYLRGVGNNAVGVGTEAAVATFVDGVYLGAQIGSIMDFNNIVSIEVAKGPQGTLFGRNATGGVILITTKTPSATTALDGSIGYGNYNTVNGKIYGTTGIAGNLAMDIAGSYRDQMDGFGTNIATGHDIFKESSYSIRSKLYWTPVANFSATLAGDFGRLETNLGAASHPKPGQQFLPNGATTPNVYIGDYNVDNNNDPVSVNRSAGGSLTLDYHSNTIGIKSISAYRWYKSRSLIDSDTTPVDLIQANLDQEEHAITQEFLLSSPPEQESLHWLAGMFYYYDNGKYDPFTLSGSQSIFVIPLVTTSSQVTHSISGFGQATYALTPTTNVTGGLRYTVDHREADGKACGGPTQLFGGPVCTYETDADGVVGPRRRTFASWTWKAGIDQQIGNDAMVYASYSRGFKSGFFNVSTINDSGVAPEKLDAYEIGLKSELFDRKVRLNVSAFYYDYSDLQVQTFQGTSFVVRNAARATIKGADFDVSYHPSRGLTLGIDGEFLDAKYKTFPAGPIYIPLPITTANPPYGFGGFLQTAADLSGNTLINAPRWTLNGTIQYAFDADVGEFKALLAPRYRSSLYFDPADQGTSRGYFGADASLRWQPVNKHVNIQIWMNNITDVRREAIAIVEPEGTSTALLPPRTFGFTLGFAY